MATVPGIRTQQERDARQELVLQHLVPGDTIYDTTNTDDTIGFGEVIEVFEADGTTVVAAGTAKANGTIIRLKVKKRPPLTNLLSQQHRHPSYDDVEFVRAGLQRQVLGHPALEVIDNVLATLDDWEVVVEPHTYFGLSRSERKDWKVDEIKVEEDPRKITLRLKGSGKFPFRRRRG